MVCVVTISLVLTTSTYRINSNKSAFVATYEYLNCYVSLIFFCIWVVALHYFYMLAKLLKDKQQFKCKGVSWLKNILYILTRFICVLVSFLCLLWSYVGSRDDFKYLVVRGFCVTKRWKWEEKAWFMMSWLPLWLSWRSSPICEVNPSAKVNETKKGCLS